MKCHIFRLSIIVFLISVFACKSDNPKASEASDGANMGQQSAQAVLPADFVKLAGSANLFFEYMALDDTLEVRSSAKWSLSGMPEWCTVSSAEGSDGGKIILSVQENQSVESRSGVARLVCGSDTTDILIRQYGRIETDYVDLRFADANVHLSFNEVTGELLVDYGETEMPVVEKGDVTVLPVEYGGGIRIVDDCAAEEGGRLLMQTSRGNMCNLFRNTSFTLATNPETADSLRVISENRVLTPYVDLLFDGRYHKGVFTDRQRIWEWHEDYNDDTILEGEFGRLWWDKCDFNAYLDCVMSFDFGEKAVTSDTWIGEARAMSLELIGDWDMDMLMCYRLAESINSESDEIFLENMHKPKIIPFTIGPIPLFVTVRSSMGQQVVFDAEGEINASAGVHSGINVSMGLKWERGKGIKPIKSVTPRSEMYPAEFEAKASASAKLSYYPRISLELYDFIGPWAEPRPYLRGEAEAGVFMSSASSDYVGWKATAYTGMDLKLGANMSWLDDDIPIWSPDIYNVVEKTIFESPKKIECLFPGNPADIVSGETVDAEFYVSYYDALADKYHPCPMVFVTYAIDGEDSEKFYITDSEGKCHIRGLRPEKSCRLVAKLVGKDGGTIAKTELAIIVDGQPLEGPTPGEVIDLGLSVKWASHNVGASSPEEFGDYFAWGETEPKEYYGLENYKWNSGGKQWNLTKYCYNSKRDSREPNKYGVPDTLTVLNPADDVANVKWGDGWRMPTYDEFYELCSKCEEKWTTHNGVEGYLVTGPNGNSIFLPASGSIWEESVIRRDKTSFTYYWSRTFRKDFYGLPSTAGALWFNGAVNLNFNCTHANRASGCTVRPVRDK